MTERNAPFASDWASPPGDTIADLIEAWRTALDAVEFRKHSGASARDPARAEEVVMDNRERYLAIEHILDIEAGVDWVERRRCDSVASESRIDEQADALRGVRDLGRDSIPGLCELLADKGIKVVEADLPESINGRSCHVLRGGEIVAEAVVVFSRTNVGGDVSDTPMHPVRLRPN